MRAQRTRFRGGFGPIAARTAARTSRPVVVPVAAPVATPAAVAIGPRLRSFALLLAILFSAGGAEASVEVSASIQPERIEAGGRAQLEVVVSGAIRIDREPTVPAVEGLRIQRIGQSTNIAFENGRMSRSIRYQYLVTGARPGRYQIGPIEIVDSSTAYRSRPVAIEVIAAGGAGRGRGGRSGGVSPGAPGRSAPGSIPDASRPESAEGGEIFARAVTDKSEAWLGEQVTLRFQFFRRAGYPVSVQSGTPPPSNGFWREELPQVAPRSETLEGRPYEVNEWLYALFPTQAGDLEIGAGSLDCTVRERRSRGRSRDPFRLFSGFFDTREVTLRSRPVAVRVRPLPEPEPEDFTGGVGRYHLEATLDRAEVAQNEPVTLNVTIAGQGNVAAIGDPILPDLPDFRTYPSGSSATPNVEEGRIGGRKEFSLVLIPQATGRRPVPPVHLSYFDPEAGRYRRLSSDTLWVEIGSAGSSPPAVSGEVNRVGWDLRTIRDPVDLRSLARLGSGPGPGFWGAQLLPALALLGAWFFRRRRDRIDENRQGWERDRAPGRLRAELRRLASARKLEVTEGFARLDQLLGEYVTARFGFPVRSRTRVEMREVLEKAGVEPEAITELAGLLDRCDRARFALSGDGAEELARAIETARGLLPRIQGRRDLLAHGAGRPRTEKRGRDGMGGGLGFRLLLASAVAGSLALGARGPSPVQGGAAPAVGEASGERASDGGASPVDPIRPPVGDASGDLASAQRRAAQGNQAFREGRFEAALDAYREVLSAGFASSALFLNAGDAAYRSGQIGWAIYYFERGRRIAPDDPDLVENLALARERAGIDTHDADQSRFLELLARLQDRIPEAESFRWLSLAWVLFALWGIIRIVRRPAGVAYSLLGLAAAVFLLLCAGWIGVHRLRAASGPSAVVVAAELPVRSNPDPGATVEFTLRGGTMLRLGRTRPGYREVLLSDRLQGWAESAGVAPL